MAEHNQQFETFEIWCNKASSWLTRHRDQGEFFQAICFDTQGRHCSRRDDFERAAKEGAFPIRWLWPDQVGPLALKHPEKEY